MKIDKWFSNLRIRNKILLLFSASIAFWLILFAFASASIRKMSALAELGGNASGKSLDSYFISFIIVSLILFLISVLFQVYLTHFTIKSLVEPVKMLSKVAVMISEGVMDGSVSSNRQDEIGQLARDFDKALSTLRNLCDDLRSLSERHGIAGDVYAKIDTSRYGGDVKEACELVNSMLWQYIADARDVLYCFSEFSNGNFNTQLRGFPGMRSLANNISDGLRKELMSLTRELGNALTMAASGNFECRLKDAEFKGEWGMIAREANGVLESIAASIREVTDAMLEIHDGNLNTMIKGDFKGDFALVKTSAANAIEGVYGVISEISDVLNALANGEEISGGSRKMEFPGDYAVAGEALKRLNDEMRAVCREARKTSETIDTYIDKIVSVVNSIPESVSVEKRAIFVPDELFSPSSYVEELKSEMSKIIEQMEDISQQASLLSLTASVEVARAGSGGKGFALVTEQISNIAERNNEIIAEVEQILITLIEGAKESESALKREFSEIAEKLAENENLSSILDIVKGLREAPTELQSCSESLKRILSIKD